MKVDGFFWLRMDSPVSKLLKMDVLPTNFVVPKKDDLFIAKGDVLVRLHIWYSAPCSGGIEVRISKGTVLYLDYNPREGVSGVSLTPMYRGEFEMEFVPRAVRREPHYGGFSISIDYTEIDELFDRLAD